MYNSCVAPLPLHSLLLNLFVGDLFWYLSCLLQIELLAEDEMGVVSSNVLFRIVDGLQRKMTKKAAQEFLDELVADHWLTLVRRKLELLSNLKYYVLIFSRNGDSTQLGHGLY